MKTPSESEILRVHEALFEEKERAQVTLNSIGDAVVCTDAGGRTTFMNIVAERLTGWECREAVGKPVTEVLVLLDAKTRVPIKSPLDTAIVSDLPASLPPNVILVRRDGSHIPIEDTVAPIHDRNGEVTGAVIVFRDVTAAKAMTLKLADLANHDALTGLPNRLLLQDRIGQAIAMASRHGSKLAILFLDLDGFKRINDSLGHSVGDTLLKSVAERLCLSVREADTVSRQGGDEFVLLLSEVVSVEHVGTMAKRIMKAVAAVHSIKQHSLRITTSMGISVYPHDGLDADTLIRNADMAMYRAKDQGRQTFRFFRPSMNAKAVQRQSIEEDLRRALDHREFMLHFQPTIDLRTRKITGAEALLRWYHPTLGSVPPAKFIPIAEDSGLIIPIGRWVLREACRQARAWQDLGLPPISIAVNVSAREVGEKNFVKGLLKTLRETGLDPQFLELELTESVLMQRAKPAASMLRALKAIGTRVAIDDFGTGYSSLSYLQKLPVDALKLDRSFTCQIGLAGEETPIVTAVIRMAHSLGLEVVAEGIETEAQLKFLVDQGCNRGQGYHFSRPLPATGFAALLSGL